MARPEDVVLYDLNNEADADQLIEMTRNYESRWFARARLASLAQRGLVAATWNPNLHPRGKDGKFITTFGWVRWLDFGKWKRGQVTGIDPDTGLISVKTPSLFDPPVMFTPGEAQQKLYAIPTPKGKLGLPDPKLGTSDENFEKIGGQGGSNPGGLYQAADEAFGGKDSILSDFWQGIESKYSLQYSSHLPDGFAIARGDEDGQILFTRNGGKFWIDVAGNPEWLTPGKPYSMYEGSDKDVQGAWGEATAAAALINDGDKVYIKHAKSKDHAKNEVLANRLYEMAGVNVAETLVGYDNETIASKLIPDPNGTKINIGQALNDPEVMARMREDFVVDAWLANWDVVGLGLENTQVIDGQPYRIDAGGALLYRAQGSPKGANFGPTVGELDTLRDPSMNPAAAKVFALTTDAQLMDGATRVAAIDPAEIMDLVDDADMPDSVASTLIARRQFIIDKFGIEDPYAWDGSSKPKIDSAPEEPVNVEPLPAPDLPSDAPDNHVLSSATSIPGINDQLVMSEPFYLGDLKDNPELIEPLVGSVLYIQASKYAEAIAAPDTEPVNLGYSYQKSGAPIAYGYVESYNAENNKLNFRFPDGSSRGMYLGGATSQDATFRVIENLSADDMKVGSTPTFKQDGNIVYAGKVVGTWEGAGWKGYNYTIFPEDNLLGKPITGSVNQKSGLKNYAFNVLLPKAPPTKKKKASPVAAKVEATVVHSIPSLDATYASGEKVELGDWVKSTKGGGGFVGKIVGWPNQSTHPGLVFAVDNDGVQKAVKVKTQKKVDAPGSDSPGELPNAYQDIKLADGKSPKVGQRVAAGKAGTQIEGIVTNINPAQGWVYIQTDDGKTVSKTFSATSVVSEPDLYWDANAAAVASVVTTTKPVKGPKTVKGPKYPGPEGALLQQSDSVKQIWLDANPSRVLTKDGYAPQAGMVMRNNAGDELIVLKLPGEWEPNANKLTMWNKTQNKPTNLAVGSLEVDHAAETTGYNGEAIKSVGALFNGKDTQSLPDGTALYRYWTTKGWDHSQSPSRPISDWTYVAVQPSGSLTFVSAMWGGDPKFTSSHAKQLQHDLKLQKPEMFEKVATFDSSSTNTVTVTPYYNNAQGGVDNKPQLSTLGFADDKPVEVAPIFVPVNEIDGAPVGPSTPIPQGLLPPITAPPNPNPKSGESVDPAIPQVVGVADLDSLNTAVAATPINSMSSAAQKMIETKDSNAAGSAVVYSMGDSDFIEDMAVRYQIEKDADGAERLVMRFRLRESVSEDTVAKLVTAGEGKKGTWKEQGVKFVEDLQDGDLLSVYVSNSTQLLKPKLDSNEPNARVVGKPVLIGKSAANPELDLYRVSVRANDGTLGEVDIERRENPTVKTFEYDHDALVPAVGSSLKLTQTAAAAGWVHEGKMAMRGNTGAVLVDDTGKVDFTDAAPNTGQLAMGSGGQRLARTLDDQTKIIFNAAHATESGTGFETTRRANIAGEVVISTPIDSERSQESINKSLSEALQAVGVPVEKQGAPSDEQLLGYALGKLVTNYHPKYEYRADPITGPDDARVQETLAYMNSKLQKHLGRNMTLDDIRLHSNESGRMSVVFSPDVAKAIGAAQGNNHFRHTGVNDPTKIFSSVANGLMSTDERWSMGVLTNGKSSFTDMTYGSGDRVYTYAAPTADFYSGSVVLNPIAANANLDVYTSGQHDAFGHRNAQNQNKMLDYNKHNYEYMIKRKIEPEQITFWVAHSESTRADYIQMLKDRGITAIGGRPIEDIIVTPQMAMSMPNFEDIGAQQYANDIPITKLVPA